MTDIIYINYWWVYSKNSNGELGRHSMSIPHEEETIVGYIPSSGIIFDCIISSYKDKWDLSISSDGVLWSKCSYFFCELLDTNIYSSWATNSGEALYRIDWHDGVEARITTFKHPVEKFSITIPTTGIIDILAANNGQIYIQSGNDLYLSDYDKVVRASEMNDYGLLFDESAKVDFSNCRVDGMKDHTLYTYTTPLGDILFSSSFMFLITEDKTTSKLVANNIDPSLVNQYEELIDCDIIQYRPDINLIYGCRNIIVYELKYIYFIHGDGRFETLDVSYQFDDTIYDVFFIDERMYVETTTELYIIGHYDTDNQKFILYPYESITPLKLK